MAIKDDIVDIKQEIGAEEQFIESIIKSERFIKKYKVPLITILVAIIVAGIWYYGSEIYKKHNFESSNEAFNELKKNPNNKSALEVLRSKNPSLYAIFEYKRALDKNDTAKMQQIAKTAGIDPLLKDIISYEAGGNSGGLMSDYEALIKGYKLLELNKIGEANAEFSKIPMNSNLQEIVENLKHYHGNKK